MTVDIVHDGIGTRCVVVDVPGRIRAAVRFQDLWSGMEPAKNRILRLSLVDDYQRPVPVGKDRSAVRADVAALVDELSGHEIFDGRVYRIVSIAFVIIEDGEIDVNVAEVTGLDLLTDMVAP